MQHGFTLIEVMVAAIVTTVGLLGVFQLHTQAKRSSFESFNYSNASVMATDVIDRMRLNPTQLANYAGTNFGAGSQPVPTTPCKLSAGVINNCSDNELLQWDRFHWEQMLLGSAEQRGSTNIGAPAGIVGCIFVTGIVVEVVVSWRGLVASSDGASNHSANAKTCGQSNSHRRQVVLNTVILNRP
ncbi:type IV pilus modification protein PilV [uncultured Ferrimonas sp.]|uniref:type IV pilus modification protein PilV n=1 Tax=uncultured Ferrimonas sp. TaxID=432640 RepID=UPI00262DC93E|nr:type IV pilus modification protein PilV [uncultured Ferrimonas sp.]